MTYRAGNGKFVKRDNPIAVISRLNSKREAEQAAYRAGQAAQRVATGRRHGYRGPLTRADLTAGA